MQIDITKVVKSYNGKSGCMCGCKGKYSLASTTSIDEANEATGYSAYDESNVSDRTVKIAVNKINKELAELGDISLPFETDHIGINDHNAWIDDGARTTAVFFIL